MIQLCICTYVNFRYDAIEFKKVSWPPKNDDDGISDDNPLSTIQLKDDIPLNDEAFRPVGTYKAAPTIYAEQPAPLTEDVWPPPEPLGMKLFSILPIFFAFF